MQPWSQWATLVGMLKQHKVGMLIGRSHLALRHKALLLCQLVPACTLLFADVAWQSQARPVWTAVPMCKLNRAALSSEKTKYVPTALWLRCIACLLLEPLQQLLSSLITGSIRQQQHLPQETQLIRSHACALPAHQECCKHNCTACVCQVAPSKLSSQLQLQSTSPAGSRFL